MYKNPNPIDLRVAAAIKFWRTFSLLSQNDLQRRLGGSRTYVSRVENAHSCPELRQFLRFAEALNVSPYILALTMEAFDVLPASR